MDDHLRLAELVCARLCHDLSGLLGSLASTLEMLTEDGAGSEAAAIASDIAAALALRLQLLRAAWAGPAEPMDVATVTALAQGVAARRVGLDVSGLPAATVFAPPIARLVLNLVLLAAESLPRGGVLRLDGGSDDVIARLEGPNAAWPPGLVGMLVDEAVAWQALAASSATSRAVQPALTALLARQHGLRLTVLQPSGLYPATRQARGGRPGNLQAGDEHRGDGDRSDGHPGDAPPGDPTAGPPMPAPPLRLTAA